MTSPAQPAINPLQSLKRKLLVGSGFEALGFVGSQLLRLASNMLLTRLLTPEAFGLSALVTLVSQALFMFSDVGLLPAIVQHKKGGDENFLNTAWTMQIIRSVGLAVIAVLVAWPLAALYKEPQLTELLVVGAIAVLTGGLTSSSLYSLRRELKVAPLVLIDLVTQVISLVVTALLAYWWRSVWALVIGGLFGTTLKSILSYLLPKSHPHRWLLEPEARTAIFAAGKWILLSSAVGFISSQADRLIMGKVAGVVDLGIYSVAVLMSGAIAGVVIQITHGVAFPALSMVKNEGIERLRSVYYKVRFGLDLAAMPALGVLCATGHVVIELLYDSRYHQAGWMLQVLVIRSAMTVMVGPCETCLFSMGRTEFAFWQGVVRAVWMAITVPLAFYWMGFSGLVWATAFSELPVMVLLWIPFHKEGMLRWLHEVRSVALLVGGYLIGLPLESIARRILL